MTSLGVQITKRIKQNRERTAIQAGKLLLHKCIPLMVGHKSHDPCFHKKYMVAGVMTFVAHCTLFMGHVISFYRYIHHKEL